VSTTREQMEQIYSEKTLDEIPWNIEQPPELLVTMVEGGAIAPCDVVDIGCGAGNYSAWLAGQGFSVAGLDLSRRAVELARKNASARGVKCEFSQFDMLNPNARLPRCFDLAFDWEVLHHVLPDERGIYLENVARLLRDGGRYLTVSFSEQNEGFGGEGKLRKTPLGTELYFSSEDEIEAQLRSRFTLQRLETLTIQGKHGPHIVVMADATKR